jgi:uncharacterized protein
MRLDISELLRVPTEAIHYHVDQPCPADLGYEARSAVSGELQLQSTSNLLVIRGHICADLVVECVRCLEPTVYSARADIEEEFRHSDYRVVSEGDQPESQELDDNLLAIFREGELDLDELIRQHLLLAVPPYFVCSEECRGLCPHCGQNLNMGTCNCPQEEATQSPFAALAHRYGVLPNGNHGL